MPGDCDRGRARPSAGDDERPIPRCVRENDGSENHQRRTDEPKGRRSRRGADRSAREGNQLVGIGLEHKRECKVEGDEPGDREPHSERSHVLQPSWLLSPCFT